MRQDPTIRVCLMTTEFFLFLHVTDLYRALVSRHNCLRTLVLSAVGRAFCDLQIPAAAGIQTKVHSVFLAKPRACPPVVSSEKGVPAQTSVPRRSSVPTVVLLDGLSSWASNGEAIVCPVSQRTVTLHSSCLLPLSKRPHGFAFASLQHTPHSVLKAHLGTEAMLPTLADSQALKG